MGIKWNKSNSLGTPVELKLLSAIGLIFPTQTMLHSASPPNIAIKKTVASLPSAIQAISMTSNDMTSDVGKSPFFHPNHPKIAQDPGWNDASSLLGPTNRGPQVQQLGPDVCREDGKISGAS